MAGRKTGRRSNKEEPQESQGTADSGQTGQDTADSAEQPRRVPGLNGYDPKLWPDA
ncbi:hypothetical protein ARTHROSP310_26050 [Arthrobacter sp. AD-310]